MSKISLRAGCQVSVSVNVSRQKEEKLQKCLKCVRIGEKEERKKWELKEAENWAEMQIIRDTNKGNIPLMSQH